MNKAMTFLSGLLIGAGVAALITMFLAPMRGEETRQTIADKGIELRVRVQDVASQAHKSSDELADEMERELESPEDKPAREI